MISALFDKHADPWARELVDLVTLNAGASGAVEEAVEKLRGEAAAGEPAQRSASLVILGPPGAGKTHLFARLRRRIGPRAVFVHVRPLVSAELTMRFVLGEIVRQLGFPTPQGMPQVNAMVGALLGALDVMASEQPATILASYAKLDEQEREDRLESALEHISSRWPETDETYLARLLCVPFSTGPTNRALRAWLSGRDCDAAQLERIGAATSLGEERALPALQTLSLVAALGAPLVLVFDQLENLMDSDGAGPRLRAYSHLASECIDVLRGAVIVHLALDSEWERGIEPSFNPSQRSRIVMRRELLSLPRAAEREQLLRLLLERVPEPHDAFPWPLGEKRVERLRSEPGITPRLLLMAFRAALAGEPDDASHAGGVGSDPELEAAHGRRGSHEVPASVDVHDLASEWQTQLDAAWKTVHAAGEARELLDAARLADGLHAAGRFIVGLRVSANTKGLATLSLEHDGETELLALVQEANHRSVGAVLVKLTALTESARVVVVRERAHELPPTWRETTRKRTALLETRRARWLDLDAEDGARLLALAAFLQAARSGDVTDARGVQVGESEVSQWVNEALGVPSWPISVGLVAYRGSGPSGPESSGAEPRSEAPAPEPTSGKPSRFEPASASEQARAEPARAKTSRSDASSTTAEPPSSPIGIGLGASPAAEVPACESSGTEPRIEAPTPQPASAQPSSSERASAPQHAQPASAQRSGIDAATTTAAPRTPPSRPPRPERRLEATAPPPSGAELRVKPSTERETTPAPAPGTAGPPTAADPPSTAPPGPTGVALEILRRLRVVSLDRLTREVARVAPESTRAAVLAELEAAGDQVRWFGRCIVCLKARP